MNNERNKWAAFIAINKKCTFIGRFNLENEAAEAYNECAKKHYGEFAWPNEVLQ